MSSNGFYINQGIMDKDFFESFILNHISSKKMINNCNKIFDLDEFIEYYTVCTSSNHQCYYNELWLLDICDDNKYYPVYIQNINTSSGYAASRCGMDREEDYYMSLDEIINICPNSTHNYINKILGIEYLELLIENNIII